MSSSPLRAKKTLIQNMFSSGDAPPRTPPIQCCVVGGDRFRVRNKRSFPSVAHYSANLNIELGGAGGSFLTICVLRGERFFRSRRNGNQQNCEFALVQTHMRTFARCAGQAGPGRATLNHPYRRCALLDPLQSHFDTRLSWPPPTMAKKVFEMISRRLVLPIEFVRLHFCFLGPGLLTWAIV